MSELPSEASVSELNDRLAREHPIDDYYARSPLPIRIIEQKRLDIIRRMAGETAGRELAEI
ncbi:MAG TPA: class I SAM-dependent methyltransferase, partial [Polyangium sp.]|nr:class I SAM-dependent methyltransferase [Polyangium sp.]